jgi:hypothetical protein
LPLGLLLMAFLIAVKLIVHGAARTDIGADSRH